MSDAPKSDQELSPKDLLALGYSMDMALRIVDLMSEQQLLEYYLSKARKSHCVPLTRITQGYPLRVRDALGDDSPGCLWAKGDVSLLNTPCISLVGSRELKEENKKFAYEVGIQAAQQGYTLVSGNARGADKTAQDACVAAGGNVICVVADNLEKQKANDHVLYLAEDGFDCAFSSVRALSRNRVIHSLGEATFVAQASFHRGGSWDGTVRNLDGHWNPVFCYEDGSEAMTELEQMGAHLADREALLDIGKLINENLGLSIF
jgi:predicted Rossmann fold nucleotide-binding protein DprA/Smf involved in DNA uptake